MGFENFVCGWTWKGSDNDDKDNGDNIFRHNFGTLLNDRTDFLLGKQLKEDENELNILLLLP